jgi:MFS family permease
MNYGWIFTAYVVAGILGPVVGGVLFDATQAYVIAFVFAGILCFIAAGCSVVVWGLARARSQTHPVVHAHADINELEHLEQLPEREAMPAPSLNRDYAPEGAK